jgi:hypothetical protein
VSGMRAWFRGRGVHRGVLAVSSGALVVTLAACGGGGHSGSSSAPRAGAVPAAETSSKPVANPPIRECPPPAEIHRAIPALDRAASDRGLKDDPRIQLACAYEGDGGTFAFIVGDYGPDAEDEFHALADVFDCFKTKSCSSEEPENLAYDGYSEATDSFLGVDVNSAPKGELGGFAASATSGDYVCATPLLTTVILGEPGTGAALRDVTGPAILQVVRQACGLP